MFTVFATVSYMFYMLLAITVSTSPKNPSADGTLSLHGAAYLPRPRDPDSRKYMHTDKQIRRGSMSRKCMCNTISL